MNRKSLIKQLERYTTEWPEEKKMQSRMLEFLQRAADAYHRSCLEGHMTASAWILNEKKDAVLLLHHAKLNKWLQPGGHADGNENLAEVALKEAQEETGLSSVCLDSEHIYDIDIHTIPARKQEPEHFHFDVRFLIRADINEPLLQNEESNALKWVALTEIEKFTKEHSVLRMLYKLKNSA